MNIDVMMDYPKKCSLKDGTEIIIRKFTDKDFDALMDFYESIPRTDRIFLKVDVTDEQIIEKWMKKMDYGANGYALVVELVKEKKIIGAADLHLSTAHWMKDHGEIRILIAGAYQRRGLGTLLSHEIFNLAVRLNLHKAEVWLMSTQKSAIDLFTKLGFNKEAILKEHVIDLEGKRHDLFIMTNNVDSLWRKMEEEYERYLPPKG